MFSGGENGQRERKKWGKERDRLNLLHKDKLIIQRKSDISSSSTKNGKYKTSY